MKFVYSLSLLTLGASLSSQQGAGTGSGGRLNVTAITGELANATIWQALERLANATTPSPATSTDRAQSGNSITGFKNALQKQPALVQLLNQTNTNATTNSGPFVVFVPLDSALSRYNVLQQFNGSASGGAAPTSANGTANITLPLASITSLSNSTSANVTALPANLTQSVAVSDLLSYHIGNLSQVLSAANQSPDMFVFPPSLLAINNSTFSSNGTANQTGTQQPNMGLFNGSVTGVLTLPTLLNATQFFSASPNGTLQSQVLTLNHTCVLPPALAKSDYNGVAGQLHSLFRESRVSAAAANDDDYLLYVNHGALSPPLKVLSGPEARSRGLVANITTQNGYIYFIDGLLIPPTNLTVITRYYNSSLGANNSTETASTNSTAPSLSRFFALLNQTSFYPSLLNASDITIFALEDRAFQSLQLPARDNATVPSGSLNLVNMTSFDRLFADQIVNGSALYASHLMAIGNATAPSNASALASLQEGGGGGNGNENNGTQTLLVNLLGTPLNVTLINYNDTQTMPELLINGTARVTRQDLLLKNGVIQVVDKFFNATATAAGQQNGGSGPAMASEAAGSFSLW